MKLPKIGELRERIAFQTMARGGDGQGGASQSWSTTATVFAKLEPISAEELQFSGQLQHRISHRIFIREGDVSNLSAEMRISFESRIFHIRRFRDLGERDRFVEIMADEGSAS